MTKIEAAGPNAAQIEYWNDDPGRKWVTLQDALDRQLESIGMETMTRTAIAAGERVIDVGCGCGATTREIARRVGERGAVLGVDISTPMLEAGLAACEREGLGNVAFANADAQTHGFEQEAFDVVFSRFGVMFFADPTAAFANLRRALRSGGRLGFVCWQALPHNEWMAVPVMAALKHIEIPRPASPHDPGPFALADAERLGGILDGAGFADVDIADYKTTLTVGGGGSIDQAVDLLMQMGPVGRAMRNGLPEEARAALAAELRETLAPYCDENGVHLGGSAWIVTGRAA